jgi:hypothetical protein
LSKKKELLMFLYGEPQKTFRKSSCANRLSRLSRRFGVDLISECESEGLIKKLTINDDPVMHITPKVLNTRKLRLRQHIKFLN